MPNDNKQNDLISSREFWVVPVLLVLIAGVAAYRFLPWGLFSDNQANVAPSSIITAEPIEEGLHIDTTSSHIDTDNTQALEKLRSEILARLLNPPAEVNGEQDYTAIGQTVGNVTPESEIEGVIERWRFAWEQKAVFDHFDTYRPGYSSVEAGLNHDEWLEQRFQEIMRAATGVPLEVRRLRIELPTNQHAIATFQFVKRHEKKEEIINKTLEFRRFSTGWKITQEKTEPA